MPYTVEYDSQTDIIYIRADGELTMENIREYTKVAALLAKEKGCLRVLSDLHEASLRLSMLDVYYIPRMITETASALGVPMHKIKRATILPDRWGLSQFFENVLKNRTQNMTLFHDIETARKWLLEK